MLKQLLFLSLLLFSLSIKAQEKDSLEFASTDTSDIVTNPTTNGGFPGGQKNFISFFNLISIQVFT